MSRHGRDESAQLRKGRAAIAGEAGRRSRWPLFVGLAVIAVLVVAIVVSVINAADKEPSADTTASGVLVNPTGATANGALPSGKADAPVRVEVYQDYMCPYCGRFAQANGAEIARLVGDGTARLETYPLSFLDRASDGSKYSTRAANAATTVYDRAPDKFLAFNDALYAHQPTEGTKGLSDKEIADLALGVGVPQSVVDAFNRRTFEPWVETMTRKAFDSGLTGTPTVKINGQAYQGDLYTVGPLTEAINQAAK